MKLAFNFQMPNESYLLLPNWYSQMKMVLLTMIPYPISQRLVGRKYQKSLPNLQCSSHSRISSPMLSNGSTRRSVRSDVSTVTSNLSSISYWMLFLPNHLLLDALNRHLSLGSIHTWRHANLNQNWSPLAVTIKWQYLHLHAKCPKVIYPTRQKYFDWRLS